MPDRFGSIRGWAYAVKSRVLHRFNLHRSRAYGPMEDGRTLHRCEWCGMSRVETPTWVTEREMRAERAGKTGKE